MKINSDEVVSLLKLSSLSSYKIAQDTGVSDQTIQNYRDGTTKPRGAILIILSKYLGISEQEIKETNSSTVEIEVVKEVKPIYNCPECKIKTLEIDSKQREIDALQANLEDLRSHIRSLEFNLGKLRRNGSE